MLFLAIKCSIRPNKEVSKEKKKKNNKKQKHNFQFNHATYMPKIVLGNLYNIPRSQYELMLKKKCFIIVAARLKKS